MRQVIKNFRLLLDKRQKRNISILFVLMVIAAFFEALGVSLMLPLVQTIMNPEIINTNERIAWVCNLLNIDNHKSFVLAVIVAIIIVFVVKNIFLGFEIYVQTRFVCNNRLNIQMKLLNNYLKRPYEFYLNAQSGEIYRVIQADTAQTFILLTTLLNLAAEMIVAIALLATIAIVDPVMTGLVAAMMGLVLLLIAVVVRPILRKQGIISQKNSANTYQWIMQSITGIKEIKVTHKEKYFEKNFIESGKKVIHAEKMNTVLGNIPRLLIELSCVCSVLIAIAIMIINGREMASLVTTLGAFVMAAMKLLPCANRIVTAVNNVAFNAPALEKTLENVRESEVNGGLSFDIEEKEDSGQITISKELTVKDIRFAYPNTDKYVLCDANMNIPVGMSVGIVGASGAGKTTVVDIMLGLLAPQSGQILADGVDVTTAYASWLSQIGYIPQSIFMLDGSIAANVAFGEDEIDFEQVRRALEEAQLAEFVDSLPDGMNTQIGERGIRLSGGQRQRIGIARALYHNPPVLIMDEATSALDNETEAAIIESIDSLHGKKTIIIIAHRLQTIEKCDMVFRVESGKINRER